jgi:hypothetical protein
MKSQGKTKSKGFMCAYGLIVPPDMSSVDSGRRAAPYIDHTKIDFISLAELLSSVLTLGSGHVLRVAGDTIDQVTLAARAGSLPGHKDDRDPGCSDFGKALLNLAKNSTGAVIDVRDAWEPLHYMDNRYTEAPPPMVIPFVVSSPDFHDAMSWANNANAMLGRDLMGEFMGDDEDDEDGLAAGEGVLPAVLKTGLENIFGWPFEGCATLIRIADDGSAYR